MKWWLSCFLDQEVSWLRLVGYVLIVSKVPLHGWWWLISFGAWMGWTFVGVMIERIWMAYKIEDIKKTVRQPPDWDTMRP